MVFFVQILPDQERFSGNYRPFRDTTVCRQARAIAGCALLTKKSVLPAYTPNRYIGTVAKFHVVNNNINYESMFFLRSEPSHI